MLKASLKRSSRAQQITPPNKINRKTHSVKRKAALGDKNSKDEAEKVLEKVVLGYGGDILEHLDRESTNENPEEECADDLEIKQETIEPKPVWEDDDDNQLRIKISEKDFRHSYFKHHIKSDISGDVYSQTLKYQHEKIMGQPSWAKLPWQKSDDDAEDSDDDDDDREAKHLLQSTGNYLAKTEALPKHTLQIKACTDANKEQPAQCKLRAMEFHPNAQVMLTGGYSQTLALFQIDGKHNPKIQSIFLEGYPVLSAHFSQNGTEVVVASKHRNFKYYDMLSGRVVTVPKIKAIENDNIERFEVSPDGRYLVFMGLYGRMHLISAESKEWITTLKMNGSVAAIAFSSDGSKMFSHGDDGEVYVWDMKTRDCIHRFVDDGCVKGTSLAVSKDGRYIAAGSFSGVVNIYNEQCLTERQPKPLRAVMNLTTPCTKLVFNSTAEILAMASNCVDKAVRMVHMPSMTVFSNFPEKTDIIRIPYCLDFSINSGYFSIGNNKGQALLYRLKHYGSY